MGDGKMMSLAHAREFMLAGRAIFTLVSKRTGQRRTFRVRRAPNHMARSNPDDFWFVDLLTGPDNGGDYRYLGFLRKLNDGAMVWRINKQRWGVDAARVMEWLVRQDDAARFDDQAEFWHEGRCGRCGRRLTDPESIERGIGPVCAAGGSEDPLDAAAEAVAQASRSNYGGSP